METDHEQEQVQSYFAGVRTNHPDLAPALDELETELLEAFKPEHALGWLTGEVPGLNGRRRIDLIDDGDVEPVLHILMRLNMGIPG